MEKKVVQKKYRGKSVKKNRLFYRTKEEFKSIIRDSGKKEILTSFSLPKWMFENLEQAEKKLAKKGIVVSYKFLATSCLKIMLKNGKRKECQIARPKRQNPSRDRSRKLSVTWKLEEYNLFYLKANHLKVCVSYLIYLALCFYLDKIVEKLLNASEEGMRFLISRLREYKGKYLHKISQSTALSLIFTEQGKFIRIFPPS